MNLSTNIPKYEPGCFADFVGDLRMRVFKFKYDAARHTFTHHTTIGRYENPIGDLRPPVGYLAYLAVKFVEMRKLEIHLLHKMQDDLLQEVNKVILLEYDTYAGPFRDWDELVRASNSYIEGRQAISFTKDVYRSADPPISIFLCHAKEDKERARNLYLKLKKSGFNPWLDDEDLIPGVDWDFEISKKVKKCDIVLVCLSEKSVNKRGYVQKEIKKALDAADELPEDTIYIIPTKLEECSVPKRLSRWHWVELYSSDGYEKLIKSLTRKFPTKF